MNNNTNETKTKACSKCKRNLPSTREFFVKDKQRKCGLYPSCKECNGLKFTPLKNIPKGYKECVKCHELLLATTQNFAKKKAGKYGVDSRCKKCDAEYRRLHKERIRKYHKDNYILKREDILKRNREWLSNNRDAANNIKQRRRARELKLQRTLTLKEWKKIKKAFNYKCSYCGKSEEQHLLEWGEGLHQEHFIPLSKGGEYSINNIVPSCRRCNASKHDIDFFEWYPTNVNYCEKRKRKILQHLNYSQEKVQQLSIL